MNATRTQQLTVPQIFSLEGVKVTGIAKQDGRCVYGVYQFCDKHGITAWIKTFQGSVAVDAATVEIAEA